MFLPRSAQNWEGALFWQFMDYDSGREHEKYTNDPIFFIKFSPLPACKIHFWISKYLNFNLKFITSVHSGLYNISIFRQKLLMRTTHHTFIESRHPEVTTNLYYFLLTWGSKIPIYWRSKKISYWVCLLFYYFFGDKKSF